MAANPVRVARDPQAAVFARAVCLSISTAKFGNSRKVATSVLTVDADNPALQARAAQRSRIRALAGLTFGFLFTIAGAVSPFVLGEGEGNADARFLMMVGFAPVVISGVFMIALFGRSLSRDYLWSNRKNQWMCGFDWKREKFE